jgi:diaminohydroxyphosphoribosylaminopyrimidine deaminase/5-amino-6-(5-phosphoribosylamino)uracil reductase
LVDRYVLYLAPAFFGGNDALGLFSGPGAPTIGGLWRGRIVDVARVGDDLRLEIEA